MPHCYITEDTHFQGIRLSKKKHWDSINGQTACQVVSLKAYWRSRGFKSMTLGDLVVTSKLMVMSQPAWWVPAHGHRHGAAIFIRHVDPELKPLTFCLRVDS